MQLGKYKILKNVAFAILPIVSIGCSSGNSGGNGAVSLGTLSTGQSVMISSGNISVNAAKSGISVGTLSVPGLASNQTVTFVMSNPQSTPSLVFAAQENTSKTQSSSKVNNVSRCTVTAQSPNCTINSSTTGADNGGYIANLVYEMANPTATGSLKPINYTIIGGNPTPPGPNPVAGTISMSLSAESLSIGSTTTATYTLTGASGFTSDILVTATSSDNQVLDAFNSVNECALSVAQPTCTITESGLSAGTAVISSSATGYTIANSKPITVNSSPAPTPVSGTISMSLSAESLFLGSSITLTYTLENSQNITSPLTIVATSSAESVLDASMPSCEVTTANPTCTITESGLSKGTAIISSNAGADYTIADSSEITVKRPLAYAYVTNAATVSLCYVDDLFNLYNCADTGSGFSAPAGVDTFGGFAYITNSADSTVSKCSINSLNGGLESCVTTGSGFAAPSGITIHGSNGNDYAYVTNVGTNMVSLCSIDTVNGDLNGCQSTGESFNLPSGISITYDGKAYISNRGSNATLCEVDFGSGGLTCSIVANNSTANMSGVSIDSRIVYFVNPDSGIQACTVDHDTGEIKDCTATGNNFTQPTGILSATLFAVYVTDSSGVSICSTDSNTGALSNCKTTGNDFHSPSSITMQYLSPF